MQGTAIYNLFVNVNTELRLILMGKNKNKLEFLKVLSYYSLKNKIFPKIEKLYN